MSSYSGPKSELGMAPDKALLPVAYVLAAGALLTAYGVLLNILLNG